MATSEQDQKGINVNQHKRMAMGEKLTGQTMQTKGGTNPISKPKGGLSGSKKK